MKNHFFYFLFFAISALNAQKVIYETELKKDVKSFWPRVDENYNLYLLVQNKAPLNQFIYKDILYYKDSKLHKTTNEFEFEDIYLSGKPNLLLARKKEMALMGQKVEEFLLTDPEGKDHYEKNVYDLKKFQTESSLFKVMYNNDFIYNVVSRGTRNESYDNRIQKEDVSLLKYYFKDKRIEKIDIKKPNVERLVHDTLFKPKVIGYFFDKLDDESFHIITKSVRKDYKNSKFYRTIYDMNGVVKSEITYNIEPLQGQFHYCNIKEAYANEKNANTQDGDVIRPTYDLDVNSHFLDQKTGDFYVFGLTSIKKEPLGFYMYKFDKEGIQKWKKFYPIDDQKVFNRQYNYWYELSILAFNFSEKEIAINVKAAKNYTDNTHHMFKISKETGNLEKYDSLMTHRKTQFTYYSDGNFELGDKKYCIEEFLVAKFLKPEIENYWKSTNMEGKFNFKAIITPKGTFVLETEKDKYFKLLLFE